MKQGETRYALCYDIANDKRRDKLAKLLADYGERVQYSIFELVLDRRLFDSLIQKVERTINPKEDRILVYALCAACDRRILRMGTQTAEAHGTELLFVV